MVNLAMLGCNGKHHVVQIWTTGNTFDDETVFRAVLINQLHPLIVRMFGRVEMFMMICALQGTDYNMPVLGAPSFSECSGLLERNYNTVDEEFIAFLQRLTGWSGYGHASNDIYRTMRAQSRGQVTNKITSLKRFGLAEILHDNRNVSVLTEALVTKYLSRPVYQGIIVNGREWTKCKWNKKCTYKRV